MPYYPTKNMNGVELCSEVKLLEFRELAKCWPLPPPEKKINVFFPPLVQLHGGQSNAVASAFEYIYLFWFLRSCLHYRIIREQFKTFYNRVQVIYSIL